MKGLIKKIYNYLISRFKSVLYGLKIKNRQSANVQLRNQKTSDVARWKNNGEFFDNWNERTAMLAQGISPDAKIIEFGAGKMFLKDYLTDYAKYTPTDIVKRFPETVISDLNGDLGVDLKEYDTAVLSGVLEYVYDVPKVFRQFDEAKIKHVLCSYSCTDKVKLSRDKNGWLSDFTEAQIEQSIREHHYAIKDKKYWKQQTLYFLEHND